MNGKQRAYLRKLANQIDTVFQVGKNGVNANFIKQVNDYLEAHELIKVKVLENSEYTTKEAAEITAAKSDAHVIQVIGTKFVLYREARMIENRKIMI